MATFRHFGLGMAIVPLLVLPMRAQQVPLPQPAPERVIINFILPVDANSVNMLLNVVNAQIRNGTKKITIVLSSSGGDPAAAFAAYNILRHLDAEITTFNVGNIDSATILIYCAGKYRYSLPSPTRFLIHSTALGPITTSLPTEPSALEAQLAQLRNLNQIMVQVIKDNTNKTEADIEAAVNGQVILNPEQAKDWGLVQDIRQTFMEPGAVYVSVNLPPAQPKTEKPSPYTTEKPVTTGNIKTQIQ